MKIILLFLLSIPLLSKSLMKDSELKGFLHLNELREKSGLNKFKFNNTLKKSSGNHVIYLVKTNGGKIAHEEENMRSKYFTGYKPWDRTKSVSYSSKLVSENISGGPDSYVRSIDMLMTAIYHRFGFLDFNKDEIGFYGAKNIVTYNMGNSYIRNYCKKTDNPSFYSSYCIPGYGNSKPIEKDLNILLNNNPSYVVYPYNNQENVLPAFYDEMPNPVPDQLVTGNPISIEFNENKVKNVNLLKIEIYRGGNLIKPTRMLDQYNDPNNMLKGNKFVLFPLNRLSWGKKYDVLFEANVDGTFFRKRWSFFTKKLRGKVKRIKNIKPIKLFKNKVYYLYFSPKIFGRIRGYRTNCSNNLDFVDYNTIGLRFTRNCSLQVNNKVLKLFN